MGVFGNPNPTSSSTFKSRVCVPSSRTRHQGDRILFYLRPNMCEQKITGYTYPTNVFDNPLVVVPKLASTFGKEVVNRWPKNGVGNWLEESLNQFFHYSNFTSTNLMHFVLIAVALTVLRYVLNSLLLTKIPVWLKMTKDSASKFPESSFNAIMYGSLWLLELYIVANHPKNLFIDLESHWNDYERNSEVEPLIYWVYMTQLGFYTHFVFATVVVNTKRKDYWVLLIHHFLTLSLTAWAYAVRFHYVGILLLFLHDIGDLVLEVAKMFKYFEYLGGRKKSAIAEMGANVAFAVFSLQWIVCRLYWYPMKVLQSTAVVSVGVCPDGAFYLPFNIMLMLLYIMQVYWFYFILNLLYKS